jgi:enoyl-CoA hydratase/carnithine racemase
MSDTYEFIRVETADHITHITLNRPEVLNALHPPAHQECARAFEAFNDDPDAWVAVISGAGERAFCAGMDLRYRHENEGSPAPIPPGGFAGLTNPRGCKIWKPIIAAVHGYVLGGGLELTMACDIVVAAENATFGLPEVKRGIVAGGGGMYRLPRQLPLKVAMGHLLTGRNFSAADAHRWGIVNEVVPTDELLPAAGRWAHELTDAAPLSVRASKQAALMGLELSLEEAYNTRFPIQQDVHDSEDGKEGVRAFAEKRKPVWRGV